MGDDHGSDLGAGTTMIPSLIVYRGRYQKRRLDLLAAAMKHGGHGEVTILWLAPQNERSECEGFLVDFRATHRHDLEIEGEVFDGRWASVRSARRAVERRAASTPAVLIGAGAPVFTPPRLRRGATWLMQGVPEERALGHGPWSTAAAKARLEWAVLRRCRPQTVVVPSERMAALVSRRLGIAPGSAVFLPNTVPLAAFDDVRAQRERVPSPPPRWVYLGSASRWQRMAHLLATWRTAAAREPSLRFRIVSTDARVPALVDEAFDVPMLRARVEVVPASRIEEIACLLADCTLGFLLRERNLVNEVSWPVKLGEYLAAGVPVAVSDLDWSISDLLRDTGSALLLDPGLSAEETAARCLDGAAALRVPPDLPRRLDHAAGARRLAAVLTGDVSQRS